MNLHNILGDFHNLTAITVLESILLWSQFKQMAFFKIGLVKASCLGEIRYSIRLLFYTLFT